VVEMKKMFCIKCGKKAEIGNFCRKCFLERKELFKIKDFHLMVCDCGSYYDKSWVKSDLDIKDLVKKMIGEKIVTDNKIVNKKISLKRVGNKYIATVHCTGFISNIRKQETKKVVVTIKKRKCDVCSKIAGGYHEAVLQIRGEKKEMILSKLKLEKPFIEAVVKIERVKNGYDIKMLDKKIARKITRKFGKKFKVKKSQKLITLKKDRRIYRDYYSIR